TTAPVCCAWTPSWVSAPPSPPRTTETTALTGRPVVAAPPTTPCPRWPARSAPSSVGRDPQPARGPVQGARGQRPPGHDRAQHARMAGAGARGQGPRLAVDGQESEHREGERLLGGRRQAQLIA